uniref:Basement membrane-specific heparan sulfate proteoglycan core protein-like isoform X2 n=1 Tax=Petromyzon marinus TaxID=7757 RepID=A0AAJ7TPW0_PETMA|nr:basement membrane-specific heparan sulfate proteoglycan core protein-like isoform X2 [Petromyzon marinus]
MDTETRRRAVWMSVVICILSRITSVNLQASPREYFVAVGQEVTLTCDRNTPGWSQHDNPNISSITWRRRGEGNGAPDMDLTNSRDFRITVIKDVDQHRVSIRIANVQHSDAGVYRCLVKSEVGTESPMMEIITMEVSGNPSRSVTEGETVTLTCLISNSGYGTVLVWYHGDIYIDQGNSVLILNKVKRSQQGQWKCAIHDQQNSPFASYKLQFRSTGSHVEKAPAVQKYFIHEGGEVSLSCDESDPGFQWKDHSQRTRAVTWKWRSHDGTTQRYDQNIQYPSQPSDYKDQFPLALSTVTFSRGGVYTCEFTGYYRTGTLTMELVTMKVSSNTSNTVAEGESISLTCQLSNDSYAHMVRWIHNGIEISHQSSLVLVKVKAAQSGLLKCSLKRESGEISEVAYNLNVRKIGAEQNAPRNYAAKIGEGTTLPCTESDPGFVWRSSSNESRSVTWYWRPRGDSTVRTILAAHPAGPHAAFSSHLNSHVNISSSAFDDDDFSLTISVVNDDAGGVYTCQVERYFRSWQLEMELITSQVPGASPYVSVAVGVVLAVLLSAGAAVVAVVGYRRRKLNAAESQAEQESAYQALNLQSMMMVGPDPQRGSDYEVPESPSVTNNDAPRQEREGHYQALKLQRKEAEGRGRTRRPAESDTWPHVTLAIHHNIASARRCNFAELIESPRHTSTDLIHPLQWTLFACAVNLFLIVFFGNSNVVDAGM